MPHGPRLSPSPRFKEENMKATLWTSGLFVVLAALLGVGRLAADDEDDKPAEPQTRIATINLTQVIRKYSKYLDYQEEIKEMVTPFQQREAELRRKMEKLREEAQELLQHANDSEKNAELLPKRKEQIENRAKKIQRAMEDLKAEAQSTLSKRSDIGMKEIFLEVQRAVESYAKKHDLDLVLQYNDALNPIHLLSTQNIARKLSSPGLDLMTSTPGIDISKEITDQLNSDYRNKS
jgi:Skp family chaperone for outer membrane proteins